MNQRFNATHAGTTDTHYEILLCHICVIISVLCILFFAKDRTEFLVSEDKHENKTTNKIYA